jgi:hypothetical protein
MRKRNLSVYDIQRELALAGHTIGINALAVLLREEGFARLPRRLDEDRPAALRPGTQAAADVRALSLQPRSFRTRFGCYAHAGIPKDRKAAEILRFADFWQERTGNPPAEPVFDSQLTTYEHLHQLNLRGIGFLTLRRRTRPMLGRIWSLPASAWRRITLPSLTRAFRTPRVLDERVALRG